MAPAEALHALQADGTLDRAGTAELIADLDFEASSLRDRVRIMEAQIEQDAKTSTDVWRVRAWQSEAILLRYVMTCAAQMRGLQRQARKLKRKDREIARLWRYLTTEQREAMRIEALHQAGKL